MVINTTNPNFSVRVLEIAYSAVKAQRSRGDVLKLWMPDDELRAHMIEAEKTLQDALIQAKLENEIAGRGGQKKRQTI
jgi:hypothetical protein